MIIVQYFFLTLTLLTWLCSSLQRRCLLVKLTNITKTEFWSLFIYFKHMKESSYGIKRFRRCSKHFDHDDWYMKQDR